MIVKSLAAALLCALAVGAHAAPSTLAKKAPRATGSEPPLALSLLRGGEMATDPVVDGRLAYFATGRVVAAWDFQRVAKPLRLGTSAPVDGVITGLVRHGDYLYASWRGYDSGSGVGVYSLADPEHPALVRDVQYIESDFRFAAGLAVANDHLYLFDSENGVFVSDLADPAQPEFQLVADADLPIQYERIKAVGNLVYGTGHNFFGHTVFDTWDTSQPRAPQRVSQHVLPGLEVFSVVPDGDRALGVGWQFNTYDLGVPGELTQRSTQEIYGALSAAIAGNRAYTFGFNEGLTAWDIRDLSAPRRLGGNRSGSTLGARHAAVMEGGTLLLPTATDLLHAYNTRQAIPHRLSTSWLPGGTAPVDVAMHDGQAVLLHNSYGITVNDAGTLQPLARFEADLPEELQQRAFEAMDVDGDVAYLAAWGYGLVTVDLSTSKPTELGRLSLPFASVVDVAGGYAYVAKNTNGPALYAVDVSNPAAPSLGWAGALGGSPYALKVSGGMAYLAMEGGLQIYSLANPAQPAQVATLDDDCGTAFDVSIDAAAERAYLACGSVMQVVDISQPAQPVVLGRIGDGEYAQFTKVAHRGNRVWFADVDGLAEIDVADPAQPVRVGLTSIGRRDAKRVLALDDGRVIVASSTGVHVFAPTP